MNSSPTTLRHLALRCLAATACGWLCASIVGATLLSADAEPKVEDFLSIEVVAKADGAPVAGAEVLSWAAGELVPLHETTSSSGRCQVLAPPSATAFFVKVRKARFSSVLMTLEDGIPPGNENSELRIELPVSVSVGGFVQTADGLPVSGATVFLTAPMPPNGNVRIDCMESRAVTDAKGSWVFEEFPANALHVMLRVSHPRFLPIAPGEGAPTSLEKLRAGKDVRTLRRGRILQGRVLGKNGEAIAGAAISQGPPMLRLPHGVTLGEGASVETAADGSFEIATREDSALDLLLTHAEFATELTTVHTTAEDRAPFVIALSPGRTVSGRIIDSRGAPVPGAWIRAVRWRGGVGLDWHTRTDGTGTFRWEHAPEDAVIVQTGHRACGRVEAVLAPDRRSFEIRLPGSLLDDNHQTKAPTGTSSVVEGRVLDALGAPAVGATVLATSMNRTVVHDGRTIEPSDAKTTTDLAGRFRLPRRSNGSLVVLHESGYGTVADTPKSATEVRLIPWGTVSGTVSETETLSGKPVRFESRQQLSRSSVNLTFKGTTTVAGRRYELKRVPAGIARVSLDSENDPSWPREMLTVVVDAGAAVEASFGTGAIVSGKIALPANSSETHHWTSGRVQLAAHGRTVNSTVDKSGAFLLHGVPAGSYRLQVELERLGNGEGRRRERVGSLQRTVEVVARDSADAVDLGTLKLEAQELALLTGHPAPEFDVSTLSGERQRLADLRGKYVLLYFWGTWCGPCRGTLLDLKQLFEAFGTNERFALLGLAIDSSDDLRSYTEKERIHWPQVDVGRWKSSELVAAYRIPAVPHCVLIDPQGRILWQGPGGRRLTDIVAKRLAPDGKRLPVSNKNLRTKGQ